MIVTLPYPPSGLNPNARLHWAEKRRSSKIYDKECWVQLREFPNALKGKTEFRFTFAPPDNKRRDVQNVVAALKGCVDLIATFTGIDDSKFKIDWPREFLPPVKNGAVYLEIIG